MVFINHDNGLAGLSSSLSEQLHDILEIVGAGLKSSTTSYRKNLQGEIQRQVRLAQQQGAQVERQSRVRKGLWHDGRLDCVSGNGIMSELGIGDEKMNERDTDVPDTGVGERQPTPEMGMGSGGNPIRVFALPEPNAAESLPVVVIRNFTARAGLGEEVVLDVLAQWAAKLVVNKVRFLVFPHRSCSDPISARLLMLFS